MSELVPDPGCRRNADDIEALAREFDELARKVDAAKHDGDARTITITFTEGVYAAYVKMFIDLIRNGGIEGIS